MWAVAETNENNKRMLSIIPMSWFDGNTLYWPKMSPVNLEKAIKYGMEKEPSWNCKKLSCRILRANIG